MVRALGAGTTGATLHLAVSGIVNLAVTRDGECVFTRVVGGGLEAMATELAERQMISVGDARAALREVVLEPPAPRVEPAPEPEDEPVFFGPQPAPAPTAAEPAEAPVAAEDPIAADARSIMAEGLRRIAGEVRNSIDFHLGSAADAPTVERVLLTGPALGVTGFADELARRLSISVEAADVPGGEHERGAFAVAAGLAVEQVAA
jgi:type IV pilus assembly protein PilM